MHLIWANTLLLILHEIEDRTKTIESSCWERPLDFFVC